MSTSSEASFADRRCLVMGVGRFGGGAGAIRYLLNSGAAHVVATDRTTAAGLARVVATFEDDDRLDWVLGEHREADFENADWVIANPAVPISHPLLERARANGARVTNEIALFLENAPGPLVAVTGTQGKSSVATFTGQLLEQAGARVHVGGNLGGSLLDALPNLGAEQWSVLELSSYQLEGLPTPLPRCLQAAAMTELLPDHLERHGTPEVYRATKERLFELLRPGATAWVPPNPSEPFQDRDWLLPEDVVRADWNWERPDASPLQRAPNQSFNWGQRALGQPPAELVGFQQRNAALACALAKAALEFAGDSRADRLCLRTELPLRPPAHRLEPAGNFAGRAVLDNAVSSTPDSTLGALEDWGPGGWLLLGGYDKGLDLGPLLERARSLNLRLVSFGGCERLLAEARERNLALQACRDLPGALGYVLEQPLEPEPAERRLLFSPAFSSFDAYNNFQARADHFRELIAEPQKLSKP